MVHILQFNHLVIFVVKGKIGEEGPRGKQGRPVSGLFSVIRFTATVYIVQVILYIIMSISKSKYYFFSALFTNIMSCCHSG